MEETWKEITWIESLRGTYEVSSLGRVRRTSLIWFDNRAMQYRTLDKVRYLKQYDNGHGYLYVALPINSDAGRKIKTTYIHRLVATAFLENPKNFPEVNHKNFVRSDNQVYNLEWCSSLDNMKHAATMDRRLKPKYPQPAPRHKRIKQ